MLKALLGFVPPTTGPHARARPRRRAQRRSRSARRIGYMPETDAHIPGMNAVSFVAYCGQLAGLPAVDAMQRAHEVLYYVGLGEARYRNVETYSTGMKQRIKLAQALVHDPDLLFLDEPTNGMDPKGRDEMLELIRDLAHNKDINLILSSHLLPDVEYTCDHVVVMDKGARRRAGADRGAQGAGGPRVRAARQGRPRSRRSSRACTRPASSATRPTRTSCACSCPGVDDRRPQQLFALAARARRAGPAPAARACRRSRTCSRRRWGRNSAACRSTTRATGATRAAQGRAGPRVARHRRRPASAR